MNVLRSISRVEHRKIVSPRRVDAEQIYRGVSRQPERTRYQKQTDEALRINDRPTVRAGQPARCFQFLGQTRTVARSGARTENPSPGDRGSIVSQPGLP